MKRIILTLLPIVLVIAFLSVPVLAKENQTKGTPFEELWAAIRDLQAQITDLQSGSVPHQSFYAHFPRSGVSLNPESLQTVPFSIESYDDGSNYDPETFIFTAPDTGVYHFDFGLYVDGSGYVTLSVNDSGAAPQYPLGPSGGSATMKLNAGDTVRVKAKEYSRTTAGYFSGYRVY